MTFGIEEENMHLQQQVQVWQHLSAGVKKCDTLEQELQNMKELSETMKKVR